MPAIDIVFFAVIGLFLLFRLYQILGSRTGSERPPEQSGWHHQITRDPNAVPPTSPVLRADAVVDPTPNSSPVTVTPSALGGLAAVKQADPSFAEAHFLRGARVAFELIVKAYSSEDKKTLRDLCDPAVYRVYEKFIDDRKARAENMDTTLVRLRDPEITAAQLLGREVRIDVAFNSEQINVTRNADGRVIDGDADRIFDVAEIWTFRRELGAGSQWFLAATKQA